MLDEKLQKNMIISMPLVCPISMIIVIGHQFKQSQRNQSSVIKNRIYYLVLQNWMLNKIVSVFMSCPQNLSWMGTDNVQRILLTHGTPIMCKIFADTDLDGHKIFTISALYIFSLKK